MPKPACRIRDGVSASGLQPAGAPEAVRRRARPARFPRAPGARPGSADCCPANPAASAAASPRPARRRSLAAARGERLGEFTERSRDLAAGVIGNDSRQRPGSSSPHGATAARLHRTEAGSAAAATSYRPALDSSAATRLSATSARSESVFAKLVDHSLVRRLANASRPIDGRALSALRRMCCSSVPAIDGCLGHR